MWHPLGFVSLTLESGDTWALKLHYWPPNQRVPKSPVWPIHDHSFHIDSRVLWGEIESELFDVLDGDSQQLYQVQYTGKDSKLMPTERTVTLKSLGREVHRQGARYQIPKGLFHRSIVPPDRSAVSVVLKSEGFEHAPLVIGDKAGTPVPYLRQKFDNDIFWEAVLNGAT